MKHLAIALALLAAPLAHAQTPAAGSIAVQVKNVGDGATTVWLGPGSPPVVQGIAAGGAPALFALGSAITVSEGALVVAPAWSSITSTPTTLAGYGITDALASATAASTYVALGGSYADPAWITSLAWSKIASTPTTLSGYGITDALASATAASTYVALGGSYADPSWITSLAWAKIASTPTTLSGYGITDALASATAASTYVALGGSYADPSWITSLAWSKIASTPTTLSGYGITDALTAATAASTYQPLAANLTAWAAVSPTTWTGSTSLTTLGTITTGNWQGTDIEWSRVSKTGSSLADLATRSAGDLSSGTLNADRLPTSGVTAASYTAANITVDDKGRVTAATAGVALPAEPESGDYYFLRLDRGSPIFWKPLDGVDFDAFDVVTYREVSSSTRMGLLLPRYHADTPGLTELRAADGDTTIQIQLPATSGTLLLTNGNGGSLTSLDPYALQQRSASDGQVLAWSTANSRWQPASVGGSGTVTSVGLSGGTTGLTSSGGPITGAGTITLGGTLALANGGTGATTASGARTALELGDSATRNVGTTAGTVAAGDDSRFHAAVTLAGSLDYLTISGQTITRGAIDLATDTTGSLAWGSVSKTGSSLADLATRSAADLTNVPVEIGLACSDETTDLTTGNAKVTFRMPHAMTLTAVRASVTTASTGSTVIVNIKEAGTTVLGTKLSIDASERTSTTAASAATITDSALADDAEITIDIDQVGSSTAGKGLKVWLIGTRN